MPDSDDIAVLGHRGIARRLGWHEWRPELAFGAFMAVCVAGMITVPRWQGVPFHLLWAGVTVLYAYRQWSPRRTAVLLAFICIVSGGLVARGGESEMARILELADLPMMALMFLVMVRVVHQRSLALEQARRASDREREFVRDASHQLRTPITIARGHVELIADGARDPEVAGDAAIVVQELARLQRISDRLLLLVSAEHPGFLALEPVRLGALVDAAAKRWTAVTDREWLIHADQPGTVLVDRARIDCALDTLIENALKATGPGDPIAVGATARGDVPVFIVADRGIGVASEDRERIFERFARGASSTRSTWGGTGLGLPLVRAIARAHGGTALLTDPPNGWTTFEIRLASFAAVTLRPVDDHAEAAQPVTL